jgi:hypothetical protein
VILGALGGQRANAFESDPFLALEVEIADSAEIINEFVNGEIELVLDRINARPTLMSCEEIPPRIYRRLFANLLSSRLKHFLEHSPEVGRFPDDDVGYWQYLGQSIYRRPIFPYILPMSSIVEVGGVRVGVDKFGHMLGEGRRYYKLYRRATRRGLDEEEAERQVVLKRLRWERIILGGLSNGVVSFADLEANYLGLKLARAMCEGTHSHLASHSGKWELARPVRIEEYVSPALDEIYYPNRFPRGRWKRVRPILEAEHCPKLEESSVLARLERYRAVDRPSLSREVVEEYFARRDVAIEEHSLPNVCRNTDIQLAFAQMAPL